MADIGILGGTFDPIHNGHLLLGKQAYQEYHLQEVWFMPSGQPPHKKDHLVTAAADRCEMLRLAIAGYPYFRLSEFEINRSGNSYTAQTLTLLQEEHPEHRFFFIIGADSLYEIEHWYRPEDIMRRVTLLVAGREYDRGACSIEEQIRHLEDKYQARIHLLHCREMDISSHELRNVAVRGNHLCKYVPEAVENYIISHKLYQEERSADEGTNSGFSPQTGPETVSGQV